MRVLKPFMNGPKPPMTTSSETYTLPADPRANACGAFFDALKSRRGSPLQIDAADVEKIDALVAQSLIIGSKTWAADDVPFTLLNPSDVVVTALDRLGLADAVATERTEHVD